MKKTNKTSHPIWRRLGFAGLFSLGLVLFSSGSGYGQVLVSTDFTGQVLPTGWDTISVTNDGEWVFDNPGGRTIVNSPGADFDSDFAIFDSDDWCGSNEDAKLVTPPTALPLTGWIIPLLMTGALVTVFIPSTIFQNTIMIRMVPTPLS